MFKATFRVSVVNPFEALSSYDNNKKKSIGNQDGYQLFADITRYTKQISLVS